MTGFGAQVIGEIAGAGGGFLAHSFHFVAPLAHGFQPGLSGYWDSLWYIKAKTHFVPTHTKLR